MSKLEILAPVGGEDTLKAVLFSGADCIYCGLDSFNARQSAKNFTPEELSQAVAFCHARGVKVNVTLNTLLYDRELPLFLQSLSAVCEAGADAVIVQDLGAAELVRSRAPGLALHGSTQLSVHTLEGALQLKEMGFSRVILARELSKEAVAHITKNCGIETEIFVHGALCMSLSGQCYMSAFLGGRSGNRGRCAGTCRLPFCAGEGRGDEYCLSLKDLSLLTHLPEIEEMGVHTVKIEGRLRPPEYVAGAVSACRAALSGEKPDMELLARTFSRSGFTGGFYENRVDKEMFGVRTKEDAAATRDTLPKLRDLYRRESPRVPVKLSFSVMEGALSLRAQSGGDAVYAHAECEMPKAQKDPTEGIAKSLSKCGGTPFYAAEVEIDNEEGLYPPLSLLNELRRAALEELLQKRAGLHPVPFSAGGPPVFAKTIRSAKLAARFEHVAQMPKEAPEMVQRLVFPLEEAPLVPKELRGRTVLELPRAMFSGSEEVERQLQQARGLGFAGFEAGNLGHLPLLRGLPATGGFTLNIANSLAAQSAAQMGLSVVTLSPEAALTDTAGIDCPAQTALLGYGHLPLMLTRACPLQNAMNCAACGGEGVLTDRKNAKFPVLCRFSARHIYNPVPLYMGERQKEMNCDWITLYFSVESQKRAAEVLKLFQSGSPFDGPFTRGLYYKGAL